MGIIVRNQQHLFLRLSVLFMCVLAGITIFTQDTFAQAPSDTAGIATEESRTADDSTPSQKNEKYEVQSGENKIESYIYNISVGLGGWIASIGGWVFDLAIDTVVLKMGCWFVNGGGVNTANCGDTGSNGAIGAVVNSLWIVIRDLFNILFIFSLIFIGLKTILSPNDSSTKKALGLLIAAALLINFSLYVTKVIVDMSNYAAIAIHDQATKGIGGTAYQVNVVNEETDDAITSISAGGAKSLSGAFMQSLNLSSFFKNTSAQESYAKLITFALMFLLTAIIVGVVFLWGGIMLITRFVALIIFMIFSPAMFLGWVLPQFKKYTDSWWKKFLSYAFFAPAYIFMLYLGLYSLIQLEGSMTQSSYAEALSSGGENFSIFLFFIIGITFLVAATKVGDSMSIAGANTAMSGIKKITGAATLGVTARVGRNTLGYGAHRISENETLKDKAATSGFSGTMARGLLKSSRVVGDSSFEVRRVGGLGKKLGLGEGSKGGYKTKTAAIIKKEEAFAKSLGEIKDDDEKVRILTTEKQDFENQLEKLKIAKEGVTGEEKKEISAKIATVTKQIKFQDKKIKAEKQRRQIGSEGDITQVEGALKEQKKYKDKIKALQNGFTKLSTSEKKTRLKEIKNQEKLLKELYKKVREKTGSEGYAGLLENRRVLGSALYARINHQDKKAGKEIRKTFKKAVNKTKDDIHFDSLKEAVSKKDT